MGDRQLRRSGARNAQGDLIQSNVSEEHSGGQSQHTMRDSFADKETSLIVSTVTAAAASVRGSS